MRRGPTGNDGDVVIVDIDIVLLSSDQGFIFTVEDDGAVTKCLRGIHQ